MLNSRFSDKKYGSWIAFTLYTGLVLVGIINHEFWMDESHHWLIARDSPTFSNLLHNYRYDGHPLLWVSLLWILGKFTTDIFFVKLLHVAIAVGVAGIWLRYAPFKTHWKILFLFTYYPIYEYSILSRNYGLAMLFLFLFCIAYTRQKKNLAILFLGLAANTHLFALLITACLFIKVLLSQQGKKNSIIAGLLFFPFLAIAIFSAKAPNDHFLYFDAENLLSLEKIGRVGALFFRAICPFPDISYPYFWNTNLVMRQLAWVALIPIILSWIIPFVLIKNKWNRLLFYASVSLLILFCLFTGLHVTQRICGFTLFSCLIFLWIEQYESKREARSSPLYLSPFFKNIFLGTFFSIQILSGACLWCKDLQSPFSNTFALYHFLKEKDLLKMPIYGGAFCNYIGLHNYGTVALQKGTATTPTTYCEWNDFKRTKKISEQEYAIQWIKKQGLDSLLVLSPSVFEVQQIKNYDMILLSSFTDGLVRNENVFVYLVTTKK